MNCTSEEIYRSAKLLGYALTPKVRPSSSTEYTGLIRDYRSNPGLREAVSQLASGLGLELFDDGAEVHGLIVRVSPGSIFTPTLEDFRALRSVEERIGYGLLFLIIAAYIYPNKEALAEDASSLGPRIRIADVVEFARKACEALRTTVPQEDKTHAHLISGFEHMLGFRETGKGERDQKNLVYMVRYLIQEYYKTGLFVREDDPLQPKDFIYFARPHYRMQVRVMVRDASGFLEAAFLRAQELRGAP